jgi:hypothetical protein
LIPLTSEAVVETDALVTPESMRLAERAKGTRLDAIRLCQETEENLREIKSRRAAGAWLTSELGREGIGFEARVRRSAHLRRGASPVDDPRSERLATSGWVAVAAEPTGGMAHRSWVVSRMGFRVFQGF